MSPTDRNPLLRKTVALREEPYGRGAGCHGVALLLGEQRLAAHPDPIVFSRDIIDLEHLEALGPVQDFLDLVVIVVAADRRVEEIRLRENLEQRQTVGVEAAGGDDVPRELRVGVRIVDRDHLAIGVEGLRKVTPTFQGCGHRVIRKRGAVGDALPVVFQIIEAEQLALAAVETPDGKGAAEREAAGIVFVYGPLDAVAVVEKVVGIEIVIPHVPIGVAVPRTAAGFGHYLHYRAAVPGVFGLVAVQNHLDFADRIQLRGTGEHARRSHVVADNAIDGQAVHVGAGAPDRRRAGAVAAAGRIRIGLIGRARNRPQHGDDLAASRGEVCDLIGGDIGGFLGAFGCDVGGLSGHGHGLRRRSEFQRQAAQRDVLVGGDRDTRAFNSLEASVLHLQRVRIARHDGKTEQSLAVTFGFARLPGRLARQLDGCARNHRTRGIQDSAGNGAGNAHLRE